MIRGRRDVRSPTSQRVGRTLFRGTDAPSRAAARVRVRIPVVSLLRFPYGLALFGECQRSFFGVLGTNQRADFAHGLSPTDVVTGDDAVVDAHRHSLAGPHCQW